MRSRHLSPSVLRFAAGALLLLLALPAGPVRAAPLVTTCADSGSGSLRAAITAAASGDTIRFQAGMNCPSASPILLTSGTLSLTKNLTIDGTGAAIAVDGNNATTVFTVNSGVIAAINALTIQNADDFGSGIFINGSGTLTVANSTLSGRSVLISGSGGSTLSVTRSTFSGRTGSGLGIGLGGSVNGGTLTVTNSTFSALDIGIRNGNQDGSSFGTLAVTNCTFAANYDSGIVTNSGVLTVTSSTFSGNGAGGGSAISNVTGITTFTNVIAAKSAGGPNLFGTFGGNNNLIDDNSGTLTGTGNIRNTPALLGTLGNNGGPTQTIPLLPGSPAINAGAPVGSGPATNPVPGADQRDLPRAGIPDIGAFEVQVAQSGTPAPLPPTPAPTGPPKAGPPAPLPNPKTGSGPGGSPNPLPQARP